MRKCERCYCEMIERENVKIVDNVGGSISFGFLIEITEKIKRDTLASIIYNFGVFPKKTNLGTITAICPECGKVEIYLDKDNLERLKSIIG